MKNKQIVANDRDKRMLAILSVIVVAFVLYYFVISPSLVNAELLKSDRDTLKTQLEGMKEIVGKLPELRKDEEKQKEELSTKYAAFFYAINEDRILWKMDAIMAAAGMGITGYSATAPVADAIKVTATDYAPLYYPLLELAAKANPRLIVQKPEPADKTKKDSKEVPPDAVAQEDIAVTFEGASYESVFSFLKGVENLERAIIVKNVNMSKSETAGVDGMVIMGIYAMPKVNENEEIDLEFSPATPSGKVNPF